VKIKNRNLDLIVVIVLTTIVGIMLIAPGYYGGWCGRVFSGIGFIVTVLLGWRLGDNLPGILKVMNYFFLWGMLLYLQTVVLNFVDGIVASAISHIVFLLILTTLWYLIIWRKIRSAKRANQLNKL
jgi:hypothetical protein